MEALAGSNADETSVDDHPDQQHSLFVLLLTILRLFLIGEEIYERHYKCQLGIKVIVTSFPIHQLRFPPFDDGLILALRLKKTKYLPFPGRMDVLRYSSLNRMSVIF